ncbi:hypothetical protein DFQ28_011173 [Apophysomyces sp. BC1034]|nr:hypothetical protein DFQ30_008406 [Apophysomyces sp. BC1015]KAG0182648.1 hypothetical protein DFQ29_002980 [Apophysomyces sp. BC1021]KAG0191698.1 hypothetical protein DFQ28_011173 [Apophysomyces sp. BC1034]
MTTDLNDSPKYKPHTDNTTTVLQVKKEKYSTSLDPRGFIPVYEYTVNGFPIMWDRENGDVLFTGVWKALGHPKSEIVKLVELNKHLNDFTVKRVRGGYLHIQGTWIPFDHARTLCKRTAWHIRQELVPIFGSEFPEECLHPDDGAFRNLALDLSHSSESSHSRRPRQLSGQRGWCPGPYNRETRSRRRAVKPMHSPNKPSSMSLSQLLNNDDDADSTSSSILSPISTPPFAFRVVQTLPPMNSPSQASPPIECRRHSEPSMFITPVYEASHTRRSSAPPVVNTNPSTEARDIIALIEGSILIQQISQDDGVRPFRPMQLESVPTKVYVDEQEFSILWDQWNY